MKLNSFQLKWIAILTMLIDHIGAVLYPYVPALRMIGRISFPIFCFLLVEGFLHTKDVYRYMLRLGIFALLSEIPYDLAFHGQVLEFSHQNVFFTLTLGILFLYAAQKNRAVPVKIAEAFLILWVAAVLRTDYSYRGIFLIAVYYFLREKKWLQLGAGAAWNFIYGLGQIQNYGVFAAVPLACYNGERGPKIKYFFYLFYPLHLLALYLIKSFCFNGAGL